MAAEMKVTDEALQAAMDAAQKFANENTVSMYATAADLLREEMRAALEAGLAAMLEPVGWQQRYARPLPNGDRCQWWECSETDMEKIRSQFSDSYELRRIYADKESK